MMMTPMTGPKVAVLVANGFNEQNFLSAQKMMQDMGQKTGMRMHVISTNQGLVNGWEGNAWGHNYAVDAPLNTALGVDYEALILVGGQRSNDKLKMTAHTRRFIGSFLSGNKPVAMMDDAIALAAEAEQLDGKTVAGPAECRDVTTQMGATWSEEPMIMDGSMLSGMCDEANKANYFAMMKDLFSETEDIDQAA